MKWMDYYGDPGEYTGEVDASNLPHGKGSMKYDHGLIQEGMWTRGQFVEGSDMNILAGVGGGEKKKKAPSKKLSGAGSRKVSASRGGASSGGSRGKDP